MSLIDKLKAWFGWKFTATFSTEHGYTWMKLPMFVKYKGSTWFAFAPHIKALGSGSHPDAAIVDLHEAVQVWYDIHKADGSLAQALTSFGFDVKRGVLSSRCRAPKGYEYHVTYDVNVDYKKSQEAHA